jgi:hypothetical protein
MASVFLAFKRRMYACFSTCLGLTQQSQDILYFGGE